MIYEAFLCQEIPCAFSFGDPIACVRIATRENCSQEYLNPLWYPHKLHISSTKLTDQIEIPQLLGKGKELKMDMQGYHIFNSVK
jgi:hypothetical protein